MSEKYTVTRKELIESSKRAKESMWNTALYIAHMDETIQRKLFGMSGIKNILANVDAEDAEKITDGYWSKTKDIKPGDEIVCGNMSAICTKVDDDHQDGTIYYVCKDGTTGFCAGGYKGPWCKTGIRNTKYVEYLTRLTMGYDMLVDNATGEVIDFAAKNKVRADIPGNQLATGGDN